MHRAFGWAVLAAGLCGAVAGGDTLSPTVPSHAQASAPVLSREEMEAFLATARIVRTQGVRKGLTGTTRATLSDGTLTHDASVQTIDDSRNSFQTRDGVEFNFRDTWRFNLAAYLLDKLLGIDMIPPTVARYYKGAQASFTWWVDDALMDEAERVQRRRSPPDPEAWNEQMWTVRVFDQLIYNTDRNLTNLLITSDWRIWMIDHSRAFRWHETLRRPGDLAKCDRQLLARLRALDRAMLQATLADYLGPNEIKGLLARRDLIVRYFDQAGDKALFDRRDR